MNFLGVKIDLNKKYTQTEMDTLERELEMAFRRTAGWMVFGTAVLTMLAFAGALILGVLFRS